MCISPGLQNKMKSKCRNARRNRAVKAAYSAYLVPLMAAMYYSVTPWGS